ncbi:MAG TPA: thioredoxin domain-containing protein [Thermoanaerobaculia bacterium]
MKALFTALTLLLSATASAADVDPKLDRAVRDALPVCEGATVTYGDLQVKLPPRFSGKMVRVESENHLCDGQFAAIVSPARNLLLGAPWVIEGEEGRTHIEKLKAFTWRAMQQNVDVLVDPKRTVDGLFRVTIVQTTANGKMPMEGAMDEDGRIFFFGTFRPMDGDMRAARAKAYEPFVANSPAKGGSKPAVTIVEFSDFQCPSCQRSAGYVDPILAKHGDKVRYVRYDLPLEGHAWAFPAALVGRAIYRQKPELFWEYKKQVYANQAGMNTFTFWDWARAFAEDHELDLAKYDADLTNEALKQEILKGAGFAFVNDVRATPSYMVNGALVSAGDEGKALAAYVDSLLD